MQNYAGSPKRFAFPLGEDLRVGVCVFSVQVFCCARLDARDIQGLRGVIIGPLTKLFQEHRGWHSIHPVWGCRGSSNSFARIPLKASRISVVASDHFAEEGRLL